MKKIVVKNTAGMFDLLKGIAMISVIFLHTYELFVSANVSVDGERAIAENANLLSMMVDTVSGMLGRSLMPGLFVVCGYGFRKTSIKKCFEHQAKALLVPYAITMGLASVLHLITHFSLYRYFKGSLIETGRIFLGSLLGLSRTTYYFDIKIFSNGPNWFLLALFWGLILFDVILNYVPEKYIPITVFVAGVIGWLISLGNTVPFCLSQGFISVLYIFMGYSIKKKKLFTKGLGNRAALIVSAYIILVLLPYGTMQFMGYADDMADSLYPFGIITIVLKGLASVLTVYLFLLLNVFRGPVSSFVRKIGRYSIYVICIHTIEMMGFPLYYFVNKCESDSALVPLVFAIVRTVVVIGICFAFVNIKGYLGNKKQTA